MENSQTEEEFRPDSPEVGSRSWDDGRLIQSSTPVDPAKLLDERMERYVALNEEEVCKSKNLNSLRSIYNGDLVHERMAKVRESIYHIRQNWSEFDKFMANLKELMLKNEQEPSPRVKALFTYRRNWIDLERVDRPVETDVFGEEFDALRLYTSNDGYGQIFGVINSVFRDDSSVESQDLITSAVFLIELINIDLYNMCFKHPKYKEFQGIVYRGMALPESAFKTFELLLNQPIKDRYVSIPLALWSSSKQYSVAENFVKMGLKKNPTFLPLIMKIHVLNVDSEYLSFYREKFQEKSIVSTICAVDITDLSDFPEESEILLRGGFYQAVHLYDGQDIEGRKCRILEMVMLNSNRDHLSTSTLLGEGDADARVLFGTMVGCTRNKFILNYCKANGLNEDATQYERLLNEGLDKLQKIMASE